MFYAVVLTCHSSVREVGKNIILIAQKLISFGLLRLPAKSTLSLVLNLLFTVLHKRIREAEGFSAMVMVATKNLYSYINLGKFLKVTVGYCKSILSENY